MFFIEFGSSKLFSSILHQHLHCVVQTVFLAEAVFRHRKKNLWGLSRVHTADKETKNELTLRSLLNRIAHLPGKNYYAINRDIPIGLHNRKRFLVSYSITQTIRLSGMHLTGLVYPFKYLRGEAFHYIN